MVNTSVKSSALTSLGTLVRIYLAIVVATLVVLVVLALTDPAQATAEAWGHGVVVAAFAVLLPLRVRSARAGRPGALRAVGLIAAILLVVNIVEALIPGFVPIWMRVQMIVVAVVMAAVVGCAVRARP